MTLFVADALSGGKIGNTPFEVPKPLNVLWVDTMQDLSLIYCSQGRFYKTADR